MTKDRFEEHIIPVTESGCWLWTARTNYAGYGIFIVNSKDTKAHRISWTLYKGEIPTGLNVLHKCDVPGCVNPDHLFLGTNQDNMEDKRQKGRCRNHWDKSKGPWLCGTDNPKAKINYEIAGQIRALHPSLSYRELGAKFGLDHCTIFRIVKGRYWKQNAEMPR